jgi:hypothetical protein
MTIPMTISIIILASVIGAILAGALQALDNALTRRFFR